ncbi:MAG: GAF domain-containing protein [Oscillochloridaceae bacterium]|nr:GAF domain-containing protein [Chloroflexaceae bacterium]MDW8390064.1 GAF domain-containing protein [Oscillochloridaceae bacterium]
MTEPAHILIVEDDQIIQRVYHDVLVADGYRVSLTASGEEALAYLHLITPDIILLDLALPGIDGLEITRRIKADRSKPFIPVMIISATADLSTSVASLDAGADDFLVKPIAIDELLARVRAMLRLQRAQRGLERAQRKTELLLHLTRDLGSSIDLDALLTGFLDHLADAVGAARASIILTDVDAEQVLCYSSSRNPASATLQHILQQGVAGWVLRERRPLTIADTRQDGRWFTANPLHSNVRSVAAMPIMREGRVLGVITLVHHTPGYFTEEHLELVTSVAAQSAVAIESAQLFRLTRRQKELLARRAEELRKVNEINTYLAELMAPEQLMRLMVYMIQQQFGYPRVSLLLLQGERLVLQADAGGAATAAVSVCARRGLSGWAIAHRQAVRVADASHDPRFEPMLPGDEQVRALLVMPVMLRREMLGTLELRSPDEDAFGPNDEAVLNAIVNQFSIALGNARLLEQEQRRISQLSQVNRLSVAITAQIDAPQNLQLAADAVAAIFGVPQAGLVLFNDAERQEQPLIAFHGGPTLYDADLERLFTTHSDARQVILNAREPTLIRGLRADPRFTALHEFFTARAIEDMLFVPLLAGQRVLGVLCIDATGREAGFGRADLELATTVASLIVQVMENARLYRVVAEERSTLNAVLRGATDPILLVGPQCELLLANRAAEECLGLNLGVARGQSLGALEHGNRPAISQLAPLIQQANGVGAAAEIVLTDDVTFSVSVAPVRGADETPLGHVAVLRDISPIKRLERQERERLRSVFRRYVSPQVAEQLLDAGTEFGHPTERDVAVIFADMRGFTTITERTPPGLLIEKILNRYFTAMTEVLYAFGGTIDKFLGDGIIGVFGSPIAYADDPQRALVASVEMQRAFARLARQWRTELGLDIGMGVGLSYGRAVVGNIGSEQRQDYTLIGDVVNTASRLSGLARAGQVIVSYHLVEALPPSWQSPWPLIPLGSVDLKGKLEPHRVYEVKIP